MRRPRRTAAGVVLAAGTLLVAGLQTATADAAPVATTNASDTVHTAAASTAAQQKIRDFWTPERMRAATPLDVRVTAPATPAPRHAGAPSVVAPTAPSAGTRSFPQAGGAWSGGGAVVKTSGRVFFTFQGRNASCSGDAITSQNRSTVITAGHCVKYQGAWHTNWTFVPGYQDGQTPYGTWTAAKTASTPQWVASEDMNFDVGMAVVAPLDGKRLAEVVGAQGLQFNGAYNQSMYAFGFPAAAPYDGKKLIYCSGKTTKDFLITKDHGLACNMTGGSSGGPWFASFDEATGAGVQASVNSFGYTFLPNTMFGPYFGAEVKSLYEQTAATRL
ncbi:serine protease [Streptomyces sp. ISL-11]|uniref:trypsin-like serine peptidase n=1 Tax=Streptomyces sp. ISL-11 TaxID=2819174 RepID=UPI001BE5AE21|nr:peptidase [Streptomyces sp. ISL-11]MBT2382163.1 peptidase [Streptomyces sp. ISL-11]